MASARWLATSVRNALIFAGMRVYARISMAGFSCSLVHFYVLAVVVGLVQGGTQALSRSLFATMVPKTRSGEFFGFFSTARNSRNSLAQPYSVSWASSQVAAGGELSR